MSTKPVAKPLTDADLKKKWAEEDQYVKQRQQNDPVFGDIAIHKHKKENKFIFTKEKMVTARQEAENNIRELQSRMTLNHPNLLNLKDYSTSLNSELCSTNYVTKGVYSLPQFNLLSELENKKRQNTGFTAQELHTVADHIGNGLKHLHSKNLAHGDIRPSTLGFDGNTKQFILFDRLGDPSKFEKAQTNNIISKKPIYMSPALWSKLQAKNKEVIVSPQKNDLFSLGMTLLALGLAEPVADVYNINGTINSEKLKALIAKFHAKFASDPQLCALVSQLLIENDAQRPDINSLKIAGVSTVTHTTTTTHVHSEVKNSANAVPTDLLAQATPTTTTTTTTTITELKPTKIEEPVKAAPVDSSAIKQDKPSVQATKPADPVSNLLNRPTVVEALQTGVPVSKTESYTVSYVANQSTSPSSPITTVSSTPPITTVTTTPSGTTSAYTTGTKTYTMNLPYSGFYNASSIGNYSSPVTTSTIIPSSTTTYTTSMPLTENVVSSTPYSSSALYSSPTSQLPATSYLKEGITSSSINGNTTFTPTPNTTIYINGKPYYGGPLSNYISTSSPITTTSDNIGTTTTYTQPAERIVSSSYVNDQQVRNSGYHHEQLKNSLFLNATPQWSRPVASKPNESKSVERIVSTSPSYYTSSNYTPAKFVNSTSTTTTTSVPTTDFSGVVFKSPSTNQTSAQTTTNVVKSASNSVNAGSTPIHLIAHPTIVPAADAKPADAKTADAKPDEAKPAETKPAESAPAKAAEPAPAEAQKESAPAPPAATEEHKKESAAPAPTEATKTDLTSSIPPAPPVESHSESVPAPPPS